MRYILIFFSLLLFTGCSAADQAVDQHFDGDGHEHDGSSPTEALIYSGESDIQEPYHIVTRYTFSGDDIYDIDIEIYDGDVELVEASKNGTLENDLEPSLYDQVSRLHQYIIGYNKFPELDGEGHSDELITISFDMRGIADSFYNAS